jgi:hypothetical protein
MTHLQVGLLRAANQAHGDNANPLDDWDANERHDGSEHEKGQKSLPELLLCGFAEHKTPNLENEFRRMSVLPRPSRRTPFQPMAG